MTQAPPGGGKRGEASPPSGPEMQQAESIEAARVLSDCSRLLGPLHPQLLPESSSLHPPLPLTPSELTLGGRRRKEERVIVHWLSGLLSGLDTKYQAAAGTSWSKRWGPHPQGGGQGTDSESLMLLPPPEASSCSPPAPTPGSLEGIPSPLQKPGSLFS